MQKMSPETLSFSVLYPPEGSSSILEVADENGGTFLHVSLKEDGSLSYNPLGSSPYALTEPQLSEVKMVARRKLSWTDLAAFGFEAFDEH